MRSNGPRHDVTLGPNFGDRGQRERGGSGNMYGGRGARLGRRQAKRAENLVIRSRRRLAVRVTGQPPRVGAADEAAGAGRETTANLHAGRDRPGPQLAEHGDDRRNGRPVHLVMSLSKPHEDDPASARPARQHPNRRGAIFWLPSQSANEEEYADDEKEGRGAVVDGFHGQAIGEGTAQENHRDVRGHHAQRRAGHDGREI